MSGRGCGLDEGCLLPSGSHLRVVTGPDRPSGYRITRWQATAGVQQYRTQLAKSSSLDVAKEGPRRLLWTCQCGVGGDGGKPLLSLSPLSRTACVHS